MFLVNARTGEALASDVSTATTRAERRKGLLGRDDMDREAALVLSPCAAVHTAFMRFPIDILFVDREWRTVAIARDVRAWRVAACLRARAVIELRGGSLAGRDVELGDRLYVTDSRAMVAPRCAEGSSQNSTTSGSASSAA